MVSMIIIDLLEHRWAAQLALTTDGGLLARPNAISFLSSPGSPLMSDRGSGWVAGEGGVEFGESENLKFQCWKFSIFQNVQNYPSAYAHINNFWRAALYDGMYRYGSLTVAGSSVLAADGRVQL